MTFKLEFINDNNGKKYKVKVICDNKVYAKKLDSDDHLLSLYYLVLWKNYPDKKNTWELV